MRVTLLSVFLGFSLFSPIAEAAWLRTCVSMVVKGAVSMGAMEAGKRMLARYAGQNGPLIESLMSRATEGDETALKRLLGMGEEVVRKPELFEGPLLDWLAKYSNVLPQTVSLTKLLASKTSTELASGKPLAEVTFYKNFSSRGESAQVALLGALREIGENETVDEWLRTQEGAEYAIPVSTEIMLVLQEREEPKTDSSSSETL